MKNLDNLVVDLAKGFIPTISNNQVKRFIREYSESQPTSVLDTCKNIIEKTDIQNDFMWKLAENYTVFIEDRIEEARARIKNLDKEKARIIDQALKYIEMREFIDKTTLSFAKKVQGE